MVVWKKLLQAATCIKNKHPPGGSTLGQQVLDPNPLSITQPAANEYKRNYFDKQRQGKKTFN